MVIHRRHCEPKRLVYRNEKECTHVAEIITSNTTTGEILTCAGVGRAGLHGILTQVRIELELTTGRGGSFPLPWGKLQPGQWGSADLCLLFSSSALLSPELGPHGPGMGLRIWPPTLGYPTERAPPALTTPPLPPPQKPLLVLLRCRLPVLLALCPGSH